jgi:hypothetical protein
MRKPQLLELEFSVLLFPVVLPFVGYARRTVGALID